VSCSKSSNCFDSISTDEGSGFGDFGWANDSLTWFPVDPDSGLDIQRAPIVVMVVSVPLAGLNSEGRGGGLFVRSLCVCVCCI
jgi:hypothetical protein